MGGEKRKSQASAIWVLLGSQTLFLQQKNSEKRVGDQVLLSQDGLSILGLPRSFSPKVRLRRSFSIPLPQMLFVRSKKASSSTTQCALLSRRRRCRQHPRKGSGEGPLWQCSKVGIGGRERRSWLGRRKGILRREGGNRKEEGV